MTKPSFFKVGHLERYVISIIRRVIRLPLCKGQSPFGGILDDVLIADEDRKILIIVVEKVKNKSGAGRLTAFRIFAPDHHGGMQNLLAWCQHELFLSLGSWIRRSRFLRIDYG